MSASVLYDEPGPRARRRALVGTVLAALGIAALVFVALRRLADQGQLDWDLWGPFLDPSYDEFAQVWGLIGEGAVNTLTAASLAIALSLVVGVGLGMSRMMLGRVGRVPVVAFIELFRGLPVIITIVFVWRAFEELDIDVTGVLPGDEGLWYLVIGLTLYNSVIIAEILRAGVASLPAGQREAALAIGMTPRQAMTTVQLPQAFRIMLPALISQLVVILKDTSLVALLGFYLELLARGNQIARILDNPIQSLVVVGSIFILINYLLSRLATWLEHRLSHASGGTEAAHAVEEVVPQT